MVLGLKSFTCLTLAAISIGQMVAAFDFQPKTPPKQQGTDVVRVSDGQTDTIALSELIPTQDALQSLVSSGPFLKMVFDQYRVIEAELDQGYWVDTVTLSNDMREGSRLVITRKSDFGARVQITGERNATELVKGLTYTFGMLGGRWQLLQTQGGTAAIPSQTQAQSGGMNVPQSETFQRKSWYAVKLDNSWYALTDSSRFSRQSLFVRFDPRNNCNGYVGYYYPANGNPPPSGTYNKSIRLNTGNKTWTVASGKSQRRYDALSDLVLIQFDANMQFITALARKNRVKVGFGSGNDYYDQLSLSGSWASIVWALDQCKYERSTASLMRSQPTPTQPVSSVPFAGKWETDVNRCYMDTDSSYWGRDGQWGGHEWGCEIPRSAYTSNGFVCRFSCGAEGDEYIGQYSAAVSPDGQRMTFTDTEYGTNVQLFKCPAETERR